MPKPTTPNAGDCYGGNSHNCQRGKHTRSVKTPDITCCRCRSRMGCGLCCENPRDLLCLNCKNWAHQAGMRAHGPVVKDRDKISSAWKIVHMRQAGKIDDGQAQQLFNELFPFELR